MADWFQFKGIKSTAMGVYVTMFSPITLPEERVDFVAVPGRSGSLTITEGDMVYDDITLSVECLVRELSKLDQMSGWLRGSGTLVLGNRPGTYYKARVVNQIEISKLVRGRPHRVFSVVFRCAPFGYVYPVPSAIMMTAPGNITNPGNVYAEPTITITGSGEIDLTIGESTLHLEDVSGSITIDVPARLAYKDNLNQCFKLTGDWPMIPVGTSAVSWTGSVTMVSIHRALKRHAAIALGGHCGRMACVLCIIRAGDLVTAVGEADLYVGVRRLDPQADRILARMHKCGDGIGLACQSEAGREHAFPHVQMLINIGALRGGRARKADAGQMKAIRVVT